MGEYAYLQVTPLKGLKRFQIKGKLAPRFIGPFKIIAKRGAVAYQLELLEKLTGIHDVFHISQLRKCLSPPTKQADYLDLELSPELTYEENPIRILDESEHRTRNKVTRFYKVQWGRHTEEKTTWEREDWLREEYPYLFHEQPESRGRDSF